MEIIAVVNQKGGVGKTTTSLALSKGLSMIGKKVLAIDLDQQRNFSRTSNYDEECVGIFEVLAGKVEINDAIQELDGYDLVCSAREMSQIDIMLTGPGKEHKLSEAIAKLNKKYDFIVIDTPPSIASATVNALVAADKVIIAAQADIYSADGLIDLAGDISKIQKYYNSKMVIDGILLTRYQGRATISKQMRENFKLIANKIHSKVYDTVIRETVSLKEAQALRQSIYNYDVKSNGSVDYKAFIKEFLQ